MEKLKNNSNKNKYKNNLNYNGERLKGKQK